MTLRVTTPTATDIVLARVFDAPRALVFDAITDPVLIPRWYGARGWNLVTCEVDLRVGGAYRYVSQGPDGSRMAQSGVYREVVRPERLVYTELFDDQSYAGDTLITTVLADEGGRTALTSTVRYASPHARDTVLGYPMARGVGESFDRLAALLQDSSTNRGESR